MDFNTGVVLICVFVFLWRVAVTMSDPIGGSAYFHYDLNADLKGLCVEANAVLKAAFVDQPRSILKDRNDN